MTKRKITLLISIFALLAFIISSSILFIFAYSISIDHFQKAGRSIIDMIDDKIQIAETEDTAILSLNLMNYCSERPFSFVFLNENGEILADNSPAIIAEFCFDDNTYTKPLCIKLDNYLSDEKKTELKEIYFGKRKLPLSIRYVSFNYDGNEYFPVEISFEKGNKNEDIIFKLSDKTANFTIIQDDNNRIKLTGLYPSSVSDKYIKKCEENKSLFISDFTKTHISENVWNGGGGFQSSDEIQMEYHYKIENKNYCLYFISMENNFTSTLFSKEYICQSLIILGVFALITIILIKIFFILYSKNEKLNKSRSSFVSAAAHELKTPLAVISNKCECILENTAPQKNIEYVNSIYDETKRMSRMVKTLLKYNKLQTYTKAEKKNELFYDILSEQVDKYRPLFEAKCITYIEAVDRKCRLKCNKELIGFAVDNYLSNAVKFTPDYGEIKITVKELMGKFYFEIYNSGSTVSQEDAPHIWEELYIGDKSRTRTDNSTGMGLSICKAIFELLNFEYDFKNLDDGVVFMFGQS